MMDNNQDATNNFVRVLILLFSIFLVVLISFNFFCVKPIGEISTGIITLLSILLVVVLSEAFDQFSIGKLVSLSRKAKQTKPLCTKSA